MVFNTTRFVKCVNSLFHLQSPVVFGPFRTPHFEIRTQTAPLQVQPSLHRELFRINLLQMPFLIVQIVPLRRHHMSLGCALILDRRHVVA